jgi:hypothetical protein
MTCDPDPGVGFGVVSGKCFDASRLAALTHKDIPVVPGLLLDPDNQCLPKH